MEDNVNVRRTGCVWVVVVRSTLAVNESSEAAGWTSNGMTIQTDHQHLSADLPVMSPTPRNNPKPPTLGLRCAITQRFQQLLGLHFIHLARLLVQRLMTLPVLGRGLRLLLILSVRLLGLRLLFPIFRRLLLSLLLLGFLLLSPPLPILSLLLLLLLHLLVLPRHLLVLLLFSQGFCSVFCFGLFAALGSS